jgi:putative acyl-CoA dehydrogenase
VAVTERGSSAPGALPATTASPAHGGPVPGGPTWRLSGRKWFVGNADADVLLVTAATEDGPGTFLVPRPADRSLRIERLRPGTAYRAWVVGDLVLQEVWGVRLDAPAAGGDRRPSAALDAARTLDGAVMAAASLRAAVRLGGTHARHRHVPGGPLDTVPLVRTLLADLAVESEAATLLALRLAAATDAATGAGSGEADPAEAAFLRLAAPVAAAWLSRRAPLAALEVRELLGSSGWDERSEAALMCSQSGPCSWARPPTASPPRWSGW